MSSARIPEGVKVYKLFRRIRTSLASLWVPPSSPWCIEYPYGYAYTPPNTLRRSPTIWMFAFQSLKDAQAYWDEIKDAYRYEMELWECLAFDGHLPKPDFQIAMSNLEEHGSFYWHECWFDRYGIGLLQHKGLQVFDPTPGTILCSEIQLVTCLQTTVVSPQQAH